MPRQTISSFRKELCGLLRRAQVIPKSDEDKARILQALSTNFLFKALEAQLQQDIVNAMDTFEVEAGKVVISQGEPGDYFYVINTGKYDVKLKAQGDTPVATLEYPSLFGACSPSARMPLVSPTPIGLACLRIRLQLGTLSLARLARLA